MQTVAELIELVHTVARAVEDLSKLVESMPGRMDARLATIQEDLGASITGMFKRLDESDEQVNQLRAFVDITLKATQTSVGETVAQLQQVIGDNRKAGDTFNETVTKSLQQHGDAIKQVTEQLTNLATTTRSEFDTLAVKATEFEQNLEIRFKYGEGVNADAVSTLRTAMGEALAGVNDQIKTNGQAIEEGRTSLRSFVDSTNEAYSRLTVRMDETDGTIVDGFATVRKEFGEQLDSITLTVTSNTEIVQNCSTNLRSFIESSNEANSRLVARMDEADGSTEQKFTTIRKEFGEQLESITHTVSETTNGMRSFSANLGELNETLTSTVRTVTENESAATERVRKAEASTAELALTVSTLDERTSNIEKGDLVNAANVTQRFAALENTLRESGEGTVRMLSDLEQGLISRIEATAMRVSGQEQALEVARTEVAEFTSSIADAFVKLDQRIEGTEHATKAALEGLASTGETTQREVAQSVQRFDEELGALREDHTSIVKTVRRLATDVEDANHTLAGHVEQMNSAIGQARDYIDSGLVRVGESLTVAVNGINERFVQLDGAMADKFTRIEHTFESVQLQVKAANDSNDERFGKAHDAVESVLKFATGIDDSMDDRFSALVAGNTAAFERVHDTLRTLDSRVEGIDKNAEHFVTKTLFEQAMEQQGQTTAECVTKAASRFDTRVDTLYEELQQTVEQRIAALPAPPAPPEPFDPAPLRVELLNRMAEMVPQLEVKDLGFDVSLGDDQSLLLTFSYGETEVVRKVPLEMGFVYRGVYRPGEDYMAGNMVTHKGSLWYAKGRPTGEPSKDITGWQLAVKCGRDGKDAVPTRSYAEHTQGRIYHETDFLRLNNRLWQCVVKETTVVPEPGDIRSTAEWTLIGSVQ